MYDSFLRKSIKNSDKKVFSIGDYPDRKLFKLQKGNDKIHLTIKKVTIEKFSDQYILELRYGKAVQKVALDDSQVYYPYIEIFTKDTTLEVTF